MHTGGDIFKMLYNSLGLEHFAIALSDKQNLKELDLS